MSRYKCPYCNWDIEYGKCSPQCGYKGPGIVLQPLTQREYEREAYKDRNNGDYDTTYYGDE